MKINIVPFLPYCLMPSRQAETKTEPAVKAEAAAKRAKRKKRF